MEGFDQLVMNWRSALIALLALLTGLCLVYLNSRDVERRATLWLSAFAASAIVTAIPIIIGFAGAYDIWPGLTFLPTQLTLWFGPLIYFHSHTLMKEEKLGRLKWLLLPGAIYWLYQCWAFIFLGDYRAKWAFNEAVHYPYVLPPVFFLGLGLTLWAFTSIWRMRSRYVAWLDDNRSDADQLEPVWLSRFIAIGIILIAVWALENILGRLLGLDYFDRYWADFLSLFLVFFLCIEALVRIDRRFPKMPASTSDNPDVPAPAGKDWEAEGLALKAEVLANSWHLEPDLSLSVLARRFGTNQTYVSRAVNQGLNTSFSSFINSLRVEHAKTLLEEGEQTILDIAFASGFGSKASFNRAFKAQTGQSPSDHRSAS